MRITSHSGAFVAAYHRAHHVIHADRGTGQPTLGRAADLAVVVEIRAGDGVAEPVAARGHVDGAAGIGHEQEALGPEHAIGELEQLR